MMQSRFALREASESDLAAIAEVHLAAYSKAHFTSRLSSATLEAYYRLFLGERSHIYVLTAQDIGSDILGFAVFGHGIGPKISQFKRENRGAILAAALRSPLAAGGKVMSRLASAIAPKQDVEPAPFLLLSIAVARRGLGAGGHMLSMMLDRARAAHERKVGLYVNCDNISALNTYVAHGFRFRALHTGQYYMERSVD